MRPVLLALVIIASPVLPAQSKPGADDCRALTLMEKLAEIAAWSGRDVVTAQAQIVCAQSRVERSRDWPSPTGGSMKTPDGSWYYPNNGGRAIDQTGALYYSAPPGEAAEDMALSAGHPREASGARERPRSAVVPAERHRDDAEQAHRVGVPAAGPRSLP
jgi:hypothetical protein